VYRQNLPIFLLALAKPKLPDRGYFSL